MNLVQTVRITQKDKWEQSSNRSRISQTNSRLRHPHPEGTAPIAATNKEVMDIVKQLIKQNPQTLKLLNNGKEATK